MAQINIRDETRDRINRLMLEAQKELTYKITQDYIITKGLNELERRLNV